MPSSTGTTAARPGGQPGEASVQPAPPAWTAAKPVAESTRTETPAVKAEPHITGQRNRPQSDPAATTDRGVAEGPGTAEKADVADGAPKAETTADDTVTDTTGKAGEVASDEQADPDKGGKRKSDGSFARLAAYKAEVAELLGGDSAARRRRKNITASGLPAADPATQEPPIKLTRPPRKGLPRSKD